MNAIENILEYLVQVIELISTTILLIGFSRAAIGFVKTEWRRFLLPQDPDGLSNLRLQLGTYILLGLDFYIVSDIIQSMIRPELNGLLNLALIVVLRTTIGFFLGREIAEIEQREHHANH